MAKKSDDGKRSMPKMKLDDYGVWIHAHKPHRVRAHRPRPQFEIIEDRRRVVRQAFFLIRSDVDQQELVNLFARALGGKIDLTDEILEKAKKTIHDHRGAILQ